MEERTAVLVFARSAEMENREKNFLDGDLLFDELNRNLLQTVRKTRLPYFLSTEKEQRGETFGIRFANAVEEIFAKGFDQVIAVGNDSPQLKKKQILLAAKNIGQGKFVLGPSLDGGFYLLGFSKKDFQKQNLTDLPWQSPQLANALFSKLSSENIQWVKLSPLADLDRFSDLKKLARHGVSISKKLKTLIGKLLKPKASLLEYLFSVYCFCGVKLHFNKGSPLY